MTDRRFVLLIRHADSEKNALGQFAGDASSDRLTMAGKLQLERVRSEINSIISALGIKSIRIAHADSERAKTTAVALAGPLGAALKAVPEFRSIRSGIAAGMTESEIAIQYPEFYNSLTLYRAGVLSSYDIPYPLGAERVQDFERIVEGALRNLLSDAVNQFFIVIGHRSSITAILLYYARLVHEYPSNFFGYIPLDPCVTSCIDIRLGAEQILWVNRTIDRSFLVGVVNRVGSTASRNG